jgi:hypothetical protein
MIGGGSVGGCVDRQPGSYHVRMCESEVRSVAAVLFTFPPNPQLGKILASARACCLSGRLLNSL